KERREAARVIEALWAERNRERVAARRRQHRLEVELTMLRRLIDRLPRKPVHPLCTEHCQFPYQQHSNRSLRERVEKLTRERNALARHDADDGQEILRLRRQLARLMRPPAAAAAVAVTVATEAAPPQPEPGNGEGP
ncbi:MAG TPA: hypothetical protein VEY12_04370, partial [Thermoplasmata archaeon]|nr:hypothetical protein [Thermoplasmata archaeon]